MRRRLYLILTFGAVVLILLSVGGIAMVQAQQYKNPSESLSAVSDVIAAGTLLLAALAGLVAIEAYRQTSRSPELTFEIIFPSCDPNQPVIAVEEPPAAASNRQFFDRSADHIARVVLRNTATVSARNPAVTITLVGLGGVQAPEDWHVLREDAGAAMLQWDGGAHQSVHRIRELPPINFGGAWFMSESRDRLGLRVEVTADGYRPNPELIRVRVLPRTQWVNYQVQRANRQSSSSVSR